MIRDALQAVKEDKELMEELKLQGIDENFLKEVIKLGGSFIVLFVIEVIKAGHLDGVFSSIGNFIKEFAAWAKDWVKKRSDAEYKLGSEVTKEQAQMIQDDVTKLKATLSSGKKGAITRLENDLSAAYATGNTKKVGKILMKFVQKLKEEEN